MSMSNTGREPTVSPTDAEGIMFPANPAWERGKKRSFGAHRTKPAAPEAPRAPSATMTHSTLAADEAPFAAEPATVTRTTRVQKSGPSGTAIAIALGAVVVLGGVGYWAMQSRGNDKVATLSPGETSSEVAAAPISPSTNGDLANNVLPQRAPEPRAIAPVREARNTAPPPAARVRPARSAAAPSAGDNSANVSATLPDGPRPYSTINPAAPTQVTPPAPSQVTPAAPAPSEAAPPAAVPTPPPVQQSAPAPTQQPTPETTTPPTH